MKTKIFVILITLLLIGGCATSKISRVNKSLKVSHEVKTIALSPEENVIADAIGIELFNRGIRIIDSNETTEMMLQAGIKTLKFIGRKSLRKLKEKGIDAYMTVHGYMTSEGNPGSLSVRLTSTHTGEIIAGISWQSGWGGMRGSIAHNIMTSNINDAAEEIADEIILRLKGR